MRLTGFPGFLLKKNQGNQSNQMNPGSDDFSMNKFGLFCLIIAIPKKKVRFKALKKCKLNYYEKLTESIQNE
jgi:hypothetical protein